MLDKQWILGRRGQQILKFFHVLFAAISFGGIASLFYLDIQLGQATKGQHFSLSLAGFYLFNGVVYLSFMGLLLTAAMYSLFTKWGFFRHHWVTLKWVGALLAFGVSWIWLGPAVDGLASLSDAGLQLTGNRGEFGELLQRSQTAGIFALLVFLTMFFISIFKPFGKRKKESRFRWKWKLILTAVGFALAAASFVMQKVVLGQYRQIAVRHIELQTVADGVYLGETTLSGFTYQVQMSVKDHTITGARAVNNRSGSYARYAEFVLERMIREQRNDVNAITAATTTSKALLKAGENALKPGSQ